MFKHGLINSESSWRRCNNSHNLKLEEIDELIYDSVLIKKEIVDKDPFEKGLRKSLNYGHTLGHAIESYFLSNETKTTLLHGEAIGIGMILESYISTKLLDFSNDLCSDVKKLMLDTYGKVNILESDINPIIDLLKYDKKNEHGNINFVLLEAIGKPKLNCLVDDSLIIESFKFYNN